MNKLSTFLTVVLVALLILVPVGGCAQSERTITAFVGSASKPAMEEAAQTFSQNTGIKVYLNLGGSGNVLSQMKIAKSGDLYIPGSPDYMARAEREGVVYPDSEATIAYLVPAILVQEGNPRGITSFSDLTSPGIEIGIADPESVCVGLYAVEILEYNGLLDRMRETGNVVTYTESCAKTASLISLKAVDAIIGWRVFTHWNPETTDVVYLEPQQVPRIAYIPGAISTFTKDREGAQRFLDFLVSAEGQEIFRKWGYLATEAEARQSAPDAKIGGEYQLPSSYQPMVR